MENEQKILQELLKNYDLADAKTQLLGSLWNRVYRVEAKNGQLYSLRLCSPVIQDKQSVEDELTWLELIANQKELQVPRPVRNRQEDLITTILTAEGKRLSCLFEWVVGEPIQNKLTPHIMHQIGRATATLHGISRKFGRPFVKNNFRDAYRYGIRLAASHREWITEHQAEIGSENVALLEAAVSWLIEKLTQIEETQDNFGIIHADLHFGNFLIQDGEIRVIDFDQLGCGHYLYDIAVLRVELFDESANESVNHADLWTHFKAGYQQVLALPFTVENELDPFIVAVELAFLDWVYNSPNPAVREKMGQRLSSTFKSIKARVQSN